MSDRQAEPPNFAVENQNNCPVLAVELAYRWDVYRRLQDLEIDCQCSTNKPLLVDLHSPTTVAQVWSVIRQSSAERHQLIDWLNNCWCVSYDHDSISDFSNSYD
ncbi:MAG: Asr1405/Asl0597 family protein [Cyanobacteria bacterium P01_G01_bin.39]